MLISLDYIVKKYNIHPSGVLHVGANVGEEAIQYEEQGIKNVVWIEANPDIFKTLVMNVSGYGHKCFNFAAGDENKEEVILHISNNAGQSSSILPLGTHARNHPTVKYTHDVKVPMCRIDSVFSNHITEKYDLTGGIDFLSMDIQGFELQALKGMGELLNQFKWAYLEVNKEQVYKGNGEFREVCRYLEGFGFHPVEQKWTRAGWGDCLFIKK